MTDIGGSSLPHLDDFIERQIKIINPNTVVDFGAGAGKYGRIINKVIGENVHTLAVEGFYQSFHILKENPDYKEVQNELIQDWVLNCKATYDLAIFGDVLEHLERKDIMKVVDRSLEIFENIIINIPLRHIFQHEVYDNDLEIHKAYVTESFFNKYYIVEKHIARVDTQIQLMNVWIKPLDRQLFKDKILDYGSLILGWRKIQFIKKRIPGVYNIMKRFIKGA